MGKLNLQDLDLNEQRVLMRVDFNVPLDKEGNITDETRIRESLPSIHHVLKHGGKLILMSHLGRPKNGPDPSLSLAPCSHALSKLLKHPVIMADDCIGPEVEELAKGLKKGDVLLLENLRFYPAEENPSSDPDFAKKLAALGDVYINDAFGAAHREHSSTARIAKYFPHKAAAGLLLQKEIHALHSLLSHPKRPFYAIVGGAKISSKIGVLQALTDKVDALFIGGGMAYPLLKVQGFKIGGSLCEDSQLEQAADFLKRCAQKKIPLYLPQDLVVANAFDNGAKQHTVTIQQGVPEGWQGMDIGPETIRTWKSHFLKGATFFWNGPVGVFEFPNFSKGTNAIAHALVETKAVTVVGGGDSVAAVNQLGLADRFTHISTGGGASLEFLEFGHLPGIDALSEKK